MAVPALRLPHDRTVPVEPERRGGRRAAPPRSVGCRADASRSSTRSRWGLPADRAKSHASRAVRRLPTCSGPVGLGANRPVATPILAHRCPDAVGDRGPAGVPSWQDPWDHWHCRHEPERAQDRGVRTRDVVIVVFPGLQGLDLVGPVEVFAERQPARRAARLPHRGRRRARRSRSRPPADWRSMSHVALAEVTDPIDTLVVVGGDGTYDGGHRHRAGRPPSAGWPRWPAGSPRCARGRSSSPRPACSTAGGPPPTGRCATCWPTPSRGHGRRRSDLRPGRRRLHLGRRHRRHGPVPRARRGRPRPRRRARGGPPPRAVPPAPGQPVAVQRPARRPDGRAGRPA